jgi:hypothetical protein
MALSFQKVSDKRLKKRSPWARLALRKPVLTQRLRKKLTEIVAD